MTKSKPVIVSAKDQIFETLKAAILSNEYKPGDILQIDKLAREFGVSATPIRETLLRLEGAGLLKLIPNKGALVNEIEPKDIVDLWEMRKILECYAGRLSAALIPDQEIDALIARVRALTGGGFDKEAYTRVDDDIHRILYAYLDNRYFREAIARVQDNSLRIRYYAENASEQRESIVSEVCMEHIALLEALKLHDPDRIEQTLRRHLENGARRTLATVKSLSAN
ncbi:MAG TPA: GntR family transcriptional regulator [Spirochaetales bacterium]|nr:GntR family transcriptional regulator [Spirochaetales bacterium]HRY53504.1 GntR family transcriptional regulator [Spirochaetia bacterium]HRZ63812.1 GntR family transcriptional regulator [Spirochaetia bacterium]